MAGKLSAKWKRKASYTSNILVVLNNLQFDSRVFGSSLEPIVNV